MSHFGSLGYQQFTSNQQPSPKHSAAHTSDSVRFATEPEYDEKLGNFVRTNTPHPKDLIKKKELLKLRNPSLVANNNNDSSNYQDEFNSHRTVNTSRPSSFQAAINEPQLPVINSNQLNQKQPFFQEN